MMYAHIYNDFGTFKVCYRHLKKFTGIDDEKKISRNLLKTIQEETGDDMVLAKKVAEYIQGEGIHIDGFSSEAVAQINRTAALSESDRIEMLITSTRNLAALLEIEWRKNVELVKRNKAFEIFLEDKSRILEKLLYHLEVQDTIMAIAENELESGDIEEASSIYWERRIETDH